MQSYKLHHTFLSCYLSCENSKLEEAQEDWQKTTGR